MIKKISLTNHNAHSVFGNPAPLGLLGLAIACFALLPTAFGHGVSVVDGKVVIDKAAFLTPAIFAIVFGGICQLITGIMDFANKNSYGGTIFTAFAFNWLLTGFTYIGYAYGKVPDHKTMLLVEILLFVTFLFLTYGFGFFSKLLFFFLLDIDLLYVCKIGKALTNAKIFQTGIGVFTLILGLIGLWIALASLINPVSGKQIFKIGLPMFFAPRRKGFDFSIRTTISEILYKHWKENAFKEMTIDSLKEKVKEATKRENILPDIYYLKEYGTLVVTEVGGDVKSVRLSANGIDLHEQLVLKKYEF